MHDGGSGVRRIFRRVPIGPKSFTLVSRLVAPGFDRVRVLRNHGVIDVENFSNRTFC